MAYLDSPIGVFDSGIGGLTVLKGLIEHLPSERWIYLGDTARLPYGNKSSETIRNYTLKNLRFLTQFKCKAFVIACNSASTQFNDPFFEEVPVFNVIDPGIKAALSLGLDKRIGILGTKATIQSQVYTKKLQAAHYTGEIFSQACPLFVPLVEEGLFEDPITDLVISKYLSEMKKVKIESLILGCTHYPLLKKSILDFFANNLAASDQGPYQINLINSAFYLSDMIIKKNLVKNHHSQKTQNLPIEIMTTDDYRNVKDLALKILQGHATCFETVDIESHNSSS